MARPLRVIADAIENGNEDWEYLLAEALEKCAELAGFMPSTQREIDRILEAHRERRWGPNFGTGEVGG